MEDKCVSIILPVYNAVNYIEKTITSVLNQTYKNFELIIVDDGATDGTSEICRNYAQKDYRISYYKQNNFGTAVARNRGIELAKGEYIAFLDHDDEYFPIKLIVQFWLSKYVSSIPCLFILIGAHSYYFVIKAIYVNLFKARGEQKHYLKQIIAILLLAFVLNVIAYFVISKSKEAIACASLLTAIVWYILCVVRTRDVDINYCEVILMFGGTIFYLGCGLLINNAIVGCVAYMIGITILAIGLEKKELLEFLTKIIDYFDPAIKIFRRKKV